MSYLLMLPLIVIGVLWGIEEAIDFWVRHMTQRPVPW